MILTNFGKLCYINNNMSTINISLPQEQISLIDLFVKRYGFANRSEFVRSIIRLLKSRPEVISDAAVYPFVPPVSQSAEKIVSEFTKTKKYSSKFLKDLKDGLKQSDYFKE